jgi:hypothetical protein
VNDRLVVQDELPAPDGAAQTALQKGDAIGRASAEL